MSTTISASASLTTRLAVFDVIAERRHAAHPHAPCFFEAAILSRTRSPITSRSNWAKDKSTFKRQPAHAGRGVELLRDRNEGDAAAVEDLDEPGEVGERPGQPVDLVDDDHVDLAGLDIGDQPFQGRPLHRAAGKAAIIIKRR